MRTRASAPRRLRRAFTLIEMITVCFILAMVLSAIFATFSVGNRSAEIVSQRTELYQTARIVSNRLYTELSSLWAPFPDPEAAEVQGDQGIVLPDDAADASLATDDVSGLTADAEEETETPPLYGEAANSAQGLSCSIEFLTALPPEQHGEVARTDVVLLTYYVDMDPTTPEEGLIRGENRLFDLGDSEETTTFEVVSPLVTELDITYYDPDNAEWTDTWENTTLPTAVLISITVDDEDDDEDAIVVTHTITFPRQLAQEIGASFATDETTTMTETGAEPGAAEMGGEGSGTGGMDYDALIDAAAGGGAR